MGHKMCPWFFSRTNSHVGKQCQRVFTPGGNTCTFCWKVQHTRPAVFRDSTCIENPPEQSFRLSPHKTQEKKSSAQKFSLSLRPIGDIPDPKLPSRSQHQHCINEAMTHTALTGHTRAGSTTRTLGPDVQGWWALLPRDH